MSKMHQAKNPAEIAKIFGCTEAQAREHAVIVLAKLKKDIEKAQASKTGKLRGLTVEWFKNRVAAFESVL